MAFVSSSYRSRDLDRRGLLILAEWSLVISAGSLESPQAQAALAELCQTYWYPLYAFVRRQGHSAEDAQDLVQGFFASAIEKNYVGDAERERGRFRSFLLLALKRYMANEWDHANRQKLTLHKMEHDPSP